MKRVILWAPLASLALIIGLLAIALLGPESEPPDPLVGDPLPAMPLEPYSGNAAPYDPDTVEGPYLLNVWASWCAPCRIEHPFLTELSQERGIPIYGINYRDTPEAARRFLAELGNPFTGLATDPNGQAALELGLTGAPETYIVDANGIVRARWPGAVTEPVWSQTLGPIWTEAVQDSMGDFGSDAAS